MNGNGQSNERFGRSVRLEHGDLAIARGRLSETAGLDNLAQSLEVLLATPLGTDLFDGRYGFDLASVLSRIDRPATSLKIIQAEIHLKIVEALSRDPRVREVREVVFDDNPRFFTIAPGGDPAATRMRHRSERRWQAIVVVDIGLDGTVALLAEGERLGP